MQAEGPVSCGLRRYSQCEGRELCQTKRKRWAAANKDESLKTPTGSEMSFACASLPLDACLSGQLVAAIWRPLLAMAENQPPSS